MRRRERQFSEHSTVETAFYVSSLSGSAACLLDATRTHWGIENSFHWVFDGAFREDDQHFRTGNGPQNCTVLRHVALKRLEHEASAKSGIQVKRLRADWDNASLLKVLPMAAMSSLLSSV